MSGEGPGTCYASSLPLPPARRAAGQVGVDLAPAMIGTARAAATDGKLRWLKDTAEELTSPGGSFDLVVSTTSFDHWADQQAWHSAPGSWHPAAGSCSPACSRPGRYPP